jgi:hypothetical protein
MFKRRIISLLSLTVLALVAGTGSAQAADGSSFPGVEKLMSQEEYSAAGLGKLSTAEVDALNRWLIRYTATDAEFIQTSDAEVKQAKKDVVVSTRLSESFDGWSGKTKFHLDNGQVWQQRLGGSYHYQGEPPEVHVKKNLFGFWTMTLVDQGIGVGVKRIR